MVWVHGWVGRRAGARLFRAQLRHVNPKLRRRRNDGLLDREVLAAVPPALFPDAAAVAAAGGGVVLACRSGREAELRRYTCVGAQLHGRVQGAGCEVRVRVARRQRSDTTGYTATQPG